MIATRWALVSALLAQASCDADPADPVAEAGTDTDAVQEAEGATGEPMAESSAGGEDCGELAACGSACVDLTSDPFNCGACDVTCSAVDGAPSCLDGMCAVGTCEPGFADCDGQAGNGCETEVDCEAGAACDTTCGSQGTLVCDDVCAPQCAVPTETCNAIDDDCNGECDEGELANCRQSLHRYYSDTLGYLITADEALVNGPGNDYVLETEDYFWLYAAMADDLQPLFHCAGRNNHYVTEAACLNGGSPTAQIGFVPTQALCGAVPLYQVSNPDADPASFFFTTDAAERDAQAAMSGWTDDGVVTWVWEGP